MLLIDAHNRLGWPDPEHVLDPKGTGARVYAEYARQKVGEVLRRRFPGLDVQAGVLAADPNAKSTETPIAIVCQFPRGASEDVLGEAHRLAWNFSRTAVLITLEPHRLIAWSCCQHPKADVRERRVFELLSGPASPIRDSQQRELANLLDWVSLLTGQLLRSRPKQFRSEGRADSMLLQNLRQIRRRLLEDGMPERFCHDLLARLIFTQFLFHRKDSEGRPFFDRRLLESGCDGALEFVHDDLASVLSDKRETYALFRWLDDKFNGDLFPGKENQSLAERERAWQEEERVVTRRRLQLLSDFVSGKVSNSQYSLWPMYSFDTIPLEFISSVYEEFLNEEKFKDKAYYTPPHLVDYVLDGVLPWEGEEWDLKILDPSCGSGIFLVRAFQRLIHRWRNAHPGQEPLVSNLKPILANNLVGVDKNPEAVRVASFSLYLTMADAIEPRYYLKREKVFPRLRGTRLLVQDFFDETTGPFRTSEDSGTFHIIVGNAPWGDKSLQQSSHLATPVAGTTRRKRRLSKAEEWSKRHGWPTPNNDIGPLFLAKAAKLLDPAGRIAMIQPASTLLHQRAGGADRLRKKLFSEYTVEEITNLTAIRRDLFVEAISPACVVILGPSKPAPAQPMLYCTPKRHPAGKVQRSLLIEPQDINSLTHAEAASEPLVWTVLALGGRRDWSLVRRLSTLPNLSKLEASGKVLCKLGIITGDKKQEMHVFRGKPYFDEPNFPDDVFLELNAARLPPWKEPLAAKTYATDPDAFKLPQLLIKQSFSTAHLRYRAATVRSDDSEWGIVCKKTYLSVHDNSSDGRHISTAAIVYNSRFAAYYLNLTSSRALYNTELLSEEVRSLPLPEAPCNENPKSFQEIDGLVQRLLAFTDAESALMDEFLDVVLPSLLKKSPEASYGPTNRHSDELFAYAGTFVRVVKSTFGEHRAVRATVFQERAHDEYLPVRLVRIALDGLSGAEVGVEPIESDALYRQLRRLHADALRGRGRATGGEGLGFQRVAFFFHAHQAAEGRVRCLYIVKPDERHYWTRSMAMRDADNLSIAILRAVGRKPSAA